MRPINMCLLWACSCHWMASVTLLIGSVAFCACAYVYCELWLPSNGLCHHLGLCVHSVLLGLTIFIYSMCIRNLHVTNTWQMRKNWYKPHVVAQLAGGGGVRFIKPISRSPYASSWRWSSLVNGKKYWHVV